MWEFYSAMMSSLYSSIHPPKTAYVCPCDSVIRNGYTNHLSTCGVHLSMHCYLCRVAPSVLSWGRLQQQLSSELFKRKTYSLWNQPSSLSSHCPESGQLRLFRYPPFKRCLKNLGLHARPRICPREAIITILRHIHKKGSEAKSHTLAPLWQSMKLFQDCLHSTLCFLRHVWHSGTGHRDDTLTKKTHTKNTRKDEEMPICMTKWGACWAMWLYAEHCAGWHSPSHMNVSA